MGETEHTGFILHGGVLYSKSQKELVSLPDAYLVCVDGFSRGVFPQIPSEFEGLPVTDVWDKVIIPGFTDLHVHAPQYQIRGLIGDRGIEEWLSNVVYPEEAKYADPTYAKRAYDIFVEDLYIGATTRAAVWAAMDMESTITLMDFLEDSGIVSCVGKVNMDRRGLMGMQESAESQLTLTRKWLDAVEDRYERTYPVLTPRSIAACSPQLLKGMGDLCREYGLPVQSHISETRKEMEEMHELCPGSSCYADFFRKSGLLGENGAAIMAHAVYSSDEEIRILKETGTLIAHCPGANAALSAGIAPVRKYLDLDMQVGLGSDVAAGASTSIFTAMKDALYTSRLRAYCYGEPSSPLTFEEVFYMATRGGGSFFGDVGTFEPGYEFDAVVIDDSNQDTMLDLGPRERIERLMYCADDRNVVSKYIRGAKIF